MSTHPYAGKPAPKDLLIDVSRLEAAFYDKRPDPADPNQLVSFGTSGHRGTSLNATSTEAQSITRDTMILHVRTRVTSAICNSGLRWPYGKRITINLAPADVRKEGPSFDLPIALAMLKLEENYRLPSLDAFCITGELALSSKSKRKRWASVGCGYFPIAIAGRRERIF